MKIIRTLPRNNERKGVYCDGRLNELLLGFKNAVNRHNTSVVLVTDGRSGMGKTTLSCQAGIILDENFGLNKIHYEPKSFLEGGDDKVGLANAKKGDFILFDEAMLISSRSALSEINRMIVQGMSMIRSKNIYVCFAINSLFDLDRNLAISRADCLLHVYGSSLIDRGRYACFFKGKDGEDRLKMLYLLGKKYYSYAKPRANFLGKFTKEFIVNEKLYEAQKQRGVNNFLRGSPNKPSNALNGRNNLIKYVLDNEIIDFEMVKSLTNLQKSMIFSIKAGNHGVYTDLSKIRTPII